MSPYRESDAPEPEVVRKPGVWARFKFDEDFWFRTFVSGLIVVIIAVVIGASYGVGYGVGQDDATAHERLVREAMERLRDGGAP